jgi:hypothetical protein
VLGDGYTEREGGYHIHTRLGDGPVRFWIAQILDVFRQDIVGRANSDHRLDSVATPLIL